ncbi:MAG: hypothetical protein QXP04_03070 [Candidatus Nanoarchaeia archaeon]|nr:hypothetical protein [Candidatus Jingweiarchaeum tengchongense]
MLDLFFVNEKVCRQIGEYLTQVKRDFYYQFNDPRENPSLGLGIDLVSNFYGAVINIDHHFWEKNRDGSISLDYGLINGQLVKGASYLWQKSIEMLNKNPDFFSPNNLANLKDEDYIQWLADDTGKIPIYDKGKHRLYLTRFIGSQLLNNRKRSVNEIYEESGHKLLENEIDEPSLNKGGLLQRFEVFIGYADKPLFKKANLLAKVMERRGLWKFEDPENKTPPIDYHLQNVAIKSGMISILSDELIDKVRRREFLDLDEELELRLRCKRCFEIVSKVSGIDPYYLDDYFWEEGRKFLQIEPPDYKNALLANFYAKVPKEILSLPYIYVDTWRY